MSLLKKAELIFAIPAWADGKNDDGSMVDAEIKISSTDGNLYVGFGHFRDGSGIPKNGDRLMPLEMSGGINQLDNSTITKLSIKITYYFEGIGRGHSDHWTFRRELVLTFSDGTVVSSGVNDPAYDVEFQDDKEDIGPIEITRASLQNQRALNGPPYG
jgi:hypothetical protein